ncbi:Poly [ADP-ribose] polymerase 2 [Lecanosticta acicola]|uniref:Poly [ADP-ribose] polymerase n=1 Tax=Lecanosticta acicola TaxID=111012 RepID=A0AAI9E8F8_9PEZI|nr:Poly [ADP-ribose] polymerase 2 [Lecanosticta acicola]
MPALRARKRAATPDAEPDPPAKRGRSAAKSKQPADDDDDDGAAQPKAAPKFKGRPAAKKMKVEDDDDEDADEKQKSKGKGKAKVKDEPAEDAQVSDAQYAKGGNLVIPLDEICHLTQHHVYVDNGTGIIYDAALNQTNARGNNNKFYRIQLLTDGRDRYLTWTRWGRVGEQGQRAVLGDGSFQDALKNFEKKFKDKSGNTWANRGQDPKPNKYVFVERSYEPDSEDDDDEEAAEAGADKSRSRSTSPAKCTLKAPVKSLMELIFNQQYMADTMIHLNYDSEKLPLGKLSKATIGRGFQTLKSLSELLDDQSLAQSEHDLPYQDALEQLSNRFYSFIPHAFGRNRPPVISDNNMLKREVELLESLTDLKDTDSIIKAGKGGSGVHPLDARFDGLGMREMEPVDRSADEFTNISEYLVKTVGATHGSHYEVLDVFRIERSGEADRFQSFGKKGSDRRLLWHGSRSTNYGGILSQGLRIAPPEAPVSGYMFGKGVYLADMSSKSANYCMPSISGGHALLLLCEAELGDPMHELIDASYTAGEDAIAKGMYSTWGKGNTGPQGWKDAECIHPSLAGVNMPDTTKAPGATNVPGAFLLYNEYIAYDVAQVRLRYLLRVKM